MFNVKRFLRHVIAAIARELNDTPAYEYNRFVSEAQDRNDSYAATVTITIRPGLTGQVQFQGTWWNARCNRDVTLLPGQIVYIVNRQGNTLYVEPGFILRTMLPMLTTVPYSQQSIE